MSQIHVVEIDLDPYDAAMRFTGISTGDGSYEFRITRIKMQGSA